MGTNKKLVAIHSALARRFPKQLMRYYEILQHNNIAAILVDASDADYWQQLKRASHYIHHYVHRSSEMQVADAVLPVIDSVLKIPRFPNNETTWHYDDKIKEAYFLEALGMPFAKSWVFYDIESALAWLAEAELPVVYKLKAGAGSSNVLLIKTKGQAEKLIRRMFDDRGVDSNHLPDRNSLSYIRNLFGVYRLRQAFAVWRGAIHYQDINPYWQRHRDYVLFQEFLPDNNFDTRITVIGDRAFAFRRHNRPDDFRASGSGNIDYDQSSIDPRCIDLALKISKETNFQSMAYDFMFDINGSPKIGEISYTYVDSAVRNCPGYYQGSSSRWVEGNKWPQYWILKDLLALPDMEEPNLENTEDFVRPL